jgi:hypothetical protein
MGLAWAGLVAVVLALMVLVLALVVLVSGRLDRMVALGLARLGGIQNRHHHHHQSHQDTPVTPMSGYTSQVAQEQAQAQ